MPRLHLTDLSVRALKPNGVQMTYWDTLLHGFNVRVNPAGTKTFTLVHGKSRRRVTIGRFPALSLAEAREEARKRLSKAALGMPTVVWDKALSTFLETHCKELRTAGEYERLLRKHFPFGNRYLSDITTYEITDILDTLPPITANNAFARLRTLFNWAKRRRYVEHSPCDGLTKPHKDRSRDRVLTHDEIRRLWQETAEPTAFNRVVRLCLLLGQRRSEIASIRPDWIADNILTFPKEVMKQKREHFIPIPPLAAEIIAEGPLEVRTWSKPKAEIDARLRFNKPFVLHDLRRCVSSYLAELEVLPHIIDAVLGHATASLHKRYNRYAYEPEMRRALERLEAKLLEVVQ